jgi:hypothetical protein
MSRTTRGKGKGTGDTSSAVGDDVKVEFDSGAGGGGDSSRPVSGQATDYVTRDVLDSIASGLQQQMLSMTQAQREMSEAQKQMQEVLLASLRSVDPVPSGDDVTFPLHPRLLLRVLAVSLSGSTMSVPLPTTRIAALYSHPLTSVALAALAVYEPLTLGRVLSLYLS